jgi:hypothetical protein
LADCGSVVPEDSGDIAKEKALESEDEPPPVPEPEPEFEMKLETDCDCAWSEREGRSARIEKARRIGIEASFIW